MNSTEPFQKPDEMTMLTAMVLNQLKQVLEQQKSNIAVIQAQAANDYYWAMFDPLDEQQWFDDDYGDIREMPMFATGISSEKQRILEFLKDRGVVKRLKVNSTQEDPEDMGWKDYFVINSFEVEVYLPKFLKYYDTYIKAAQPALTQFLVRSGRLESDTKPSPPESGQEQIQDTNNSESPVQKIALHPLKPQHYSNKKGTLVLNSITELAISTKGRTMHHNGKPYAQCKLMGLLFKNVKTIKSGIFFSTFYGVNDRYIDKKMEKKIRNTVSEINKKVAGVGGPKNLIYVQDKKVHVNHSYL